MHRAPWPVTNLVEQQTNAGRHLFDGTIRVSIAEALIFPTGLVTAAFLTRWLGPSDYGLLSLSAGLVGWIQWSIAAMFGRASTIYVSRSKNWQDIGTTILRLFLVTGLLAGFCLWWLADFAAALLDAPRLAGLLRIFAIDIPLFALVQAHRSLLIGTGRYRQRAWSSAGRWLARMVLIITLVGFGLSIEGAILGSIGATLLELLISRYFVKPRLFARSDFPAARLLRFAIPFYLLSTGIQLLSTMDIFALKILGGSTAQAGIYGAAQNLALVPVIFSIAFAPLLQSTLIRLVRDRQAREARSMARESIRLAVLLLPFAAMTAGTATEISVLIFGRHFVESGPLLGWLICGTVLHVFLSVNTGILIAADRTRWALFSVAVVIPIAILGYMRVIPVFGPAGAAMVTAGAYLVASINSSVAVKLSWNLPLPGLTLLRSLVIGLLAYSAAVWWPASGFELVLKLVIISLAIPLLFILSGELTGRDLAFVTANFGSEAQTEADQGMGGNSRSGED